MCYNLSPLSSPERTPCFSPGRIMASVKSPVQRQMEEAVQALHSPKRRVRPLQARQLFQDTPAVPAPTSPKKPILPFALTLQRQSDPWITNTEEEDKKNFKEHAEKFQKSESEKLMQRLNSLLEKQGASFTPKELPEGTDSLPTIWKNAYQGAWGLVWDEMLTNGPLPTDILNARPTSGPCKGLSLLNLAYKEREASEDKEYAQELSDVLVDLFFTLCQAGPAKANKRPQATIDENALEGRKRTSGVSSF